MVVFIMIPSVLLSVNLFDMEKYIIMYDPIMAKRIAELSHNILLTLMNTTKNSGIEPLNEKYYIRKIKKDE